MLKEMVQILGHQGSGTPRLALSKAWTGEQPRLVKRLTWPAEVRRAIEAERRRGPKASGKTVYWEKRPDKNGVPRACDAERQRAKTQRELDAL